MNSRELLQQLEASEQKLGMAISSFAHLVSQVSEPYESLTTLKVRLAKAEEATENEVRRQVAIAVNTVEQEWHHKLQLQEAEYKCKILLLEQELLFRRESRTS